MTETLVLSVGLDPLILGARESILRAAGCIVVSAMSIKEALHLFQDGDFDLLILCHTLPVKDRERLICLIKASGSRIPVASISGMPGQESVFSDVTLDKSPVELLAGIKRLMTKRFEFTSTRSSVARGNPQTNVAPQESRADLESGSRRNACRPARIHPDVSDSSLALNSEMTFSSGRS